MIIVTGSVEIKTGKLDAALQLSLEHVHRSRLEEGCISHAVNTDAEDPSVLFFFERWRDNDALMQHFAVPESQQFVKEIAMLAVDAPQLNIYEAKKLDN